MSKPTTPTTIKYRGRIYKRAAAPVTQADIRDGLYLGLYRVINEFTVGKLTLARGTYFKVSALGLANTPTGRLIVFKPGKETQFVTEELKQHKFDIDFLGNG